MQRQRLWSRGFIASAALACALLSACELMPAKPVHVVFKRLDGVHGGERVTLGGQRIGTTASPIVADGVVRVPVHLDYRQRRALPAGAVFIVRGPASPDTTFSLEVLDAGLATDSTDTQTYRGVASEIELALLVGAERAQGLWRSVVR